MEDDSCKEVIEKLLSDIVNKGLMDEKDTATIIKEQAHAICSHFSKPSVVPSKQQIYDLIKSYHTTVFDCVCVRQDEWWLLARAIHNLITGKTGTPNLEPKRCDCGEILSNYCPKCKKDWES